MKLNPEEVLKLADKHYRELKREKCRENPALAVQQGGVAPFPGIQSDQVKALCRALCEMINGGEKEDTVVKSEYRLVDGKRRWVTFDPKTGEVFNQDLYLHQDGDYSKLCSQPSHCRCSQ